VLFEGTAAENIAYGHPHATREQIVAAAKLAEIHDVLENLPNGYDTPLGQAGAKLSGGQKQRLVIARAVLVNPVVLILDEATSSLDTESERLIQRALRKVMRNRTCFVIAHRLSTIQHADLIVVMDEGRILETGTHGELLARPDSHYGQMYRRQFAKIDRRQDQAAAVA
jgi:ABC-type multidrug transport system fused ATPase/permease subunit